MDILIGVGVLIAAIFLLRAIGAWMLRIDEIIKLQKQTLEELKTIAKRAVSLYDMNLKIIHDA